jgi:BASS family bile acid:Na+ symporter
MTAERLIRILVTVTLVEMMAAIGLGVTFADLAGVARNGRLLARAALANYLCVPAVTLGLLLLFQARAGVAAGFLIVAVCPGAPYGPPFAAIARGNVAAAVGLMVILAGSSALLAPVLLQVLLPLASEGDQPVVDAARMVGTLLLTQLLPLGAGMFLRQCRPALAARLQEPATLVSKVLNLLVLAAILVAQFDTLAKVPPSGFVGMLALLVASLAVGWLLGGRASDDRRGLALTTSLRNIGVGLVIATDAFAGTEAVTAVLAYGVVEVIGSLLVAQAWGLPDQFDSVVSFTEEVQAIPEVDRESRPRPVVPWWAQDRLIDRLPGPPPKTDFIPAVRQVIVGEPDFVHSPVCPFFPFPCPGQVEDPVCLHRLRPAADRHPRRQGHHERRPHLALLGFTLDRPPVYTHTGGQGLRILTKKGTPGDSWSRSWISGSGHHP